MVFDDKRMKMIYYMYNIIKYIAQRLPPRDKVEDNIERQNRNLYDKTTKVIF